MLSILLVQLIANGWRVQNPCQLSPRDIRMYLITSKSLQLQWKQSSTTLLCGKAAFPIPILVAGWQCLYYAPRVSSVGGGTTCCRLWVPLFAQLAAPWSPWPPEPGHSTEPRAMSVSSCGSPRFGSWWGKGQNCQTKSIRMLQRDLLRVIAH